MHTCDVLYKPGSMRSGLLARPVERNFCMPGGIEGAIQQHSANSAAHAGAATGAAFRGKCDTSTTLRPSSAFDSIIGVEPSCYPGGRTRNTHVRARTSPLPLRTLDVAEQVVCPVANPSGAHVCVRAKPCMCGFPHVCARAKPCMCGCPPNCVCRGPVSLPSGKINTSYY